MEIDTSVLFTRSIGQEDDANHANEYHYSEHVITIATSYPSYIILRIICQN